MICMTYLAHVFWHEGLHYSYADPAQPLTTASEEVDDLSVDDLSVDDLLRGTRVNRTKYLLVKDSEIYRFLYYRRSYY